MKDYENMFLATLMKKYSVGDNHLVFLPMNTMCGSVAFFNNVPTVDENNEEVFEILPEYDETVENGDFATIFIDSAGNNYFPLDDYDFLISNCDQCYTTLVRVTDLIEGEPTEENVQEAIQNFSEETQHLIVDAKYDDEKDEYSFTPIFLDKVFTTTEENVEEIEKDDNDKEGTVSLTADDLLSLLAENAFDIDQLRDIRSQLTETAENIKVLEEFVDNELKKEEAPSDKPTSKIVALLKDQYNVDTFDRNEVFKKVSSAVISQDEHIARILSELQRIDIAEATGSIEYNSAILLTGSTGVGKTEMMRQIAKAINRPFTIVDTNQLTTAGYVGLDIEEVLYQLYLDCNKDIKKAEKAIIFFDEIDKKGSSNKDDPHGKGVLNELLKFVDGTTYMAKPNIHSTYGVNIDTSHMRVIFGGAFTEVYKDFGRRNAQIGFNKTEVVKKEPNIDDFVEKAQIPDEFMGRCSVVIHLNDLEEKDLAEILVKSDISEIKNQQKIFKQIGINLKCSDSYIKEIAHQAYLEKTGARSLRGKVSASAWSALDYAIDHTGEFDTVTFNKNTALDSRKYHIYKKEIKNMEKVKTKKKSK